MTASELKGGKLVTCKEAARMLRNGEATQAIFRPDSLHNGHAPFSDDDPAVVWK